MLVKATSDTIEAGTRKIWENVKLASNSTVSPYYTFTENLSTITIKTVASYSTYDNGFNLTLYNTSGSAVQSSINVLPYSGSATTKETTITGIQAGYYLSCYTNRGGTYTTTITGPGILYKDGKNYPINYPQEQKGLGETLFTLLYGNSSEGIYVGGIVKGKSTTAYSGSITPSNYVGYITVLYNGEEIKIPYYN